MHASTVASHEAAHVPCLIPRRIRSILCSQRAADAQTCPPFPLEMPERHKITYPIPACADPRCTGRRFRLRSLVRVSKQSKCDWSSRYGSQVQMDWCASLGLVLGIPPARHASLSASLHICASLFCAWDCRACVEKDMIEMPPTKEAKTR